MSITNIFDTVVYHPTPDEPALIDRFPFSADLLGAVHNQLGRIKELVPSAEEIEIDSTWRIDRSCEDIPVIDYALRDLRDFLDICMQVRIPIGKADSKHVITVLLDPSLGPSETHQLKVSQRRIEITGADARGIMRAVFYLQKLMTQRQAPFLNRQRVIRKPAMPIRLYRSPVACFHQEATGLYDGEHYHGNILSKIAHHGFSGIWVKAWLRDLIEPVGGIEWEYQNQTEHREELKRLIDRAAEYGLSVYLHIQEPQGGHQDDAFWKNNQNLRGDFFEVRKQYALCSSIPEVKRYIEEGFYQLFKQLPELAGITLITASEYMSHCFSHVLNPDIEITFQHWPIYEVECPRCKRRSGPEVAAEIIDLTEKGIHRASPEADVIAWNWSWSQWEADPQLSILEKLSEKVSVMADCDRGGAFQIFGDTFINDEYSLTYPGPSERFMKTAAFQRNKHRTILAKVQISTTHEAGSLPHLPVMQSLLEKMQGLRDQNCKGGMFTWNFGCFTSILTKLAAEFYFDPVPEPDKILLNIAQCHYGPQASPEIVKAWACFSEGGKYYPRDATAVSLQPFNHGPAFPLFLEKKEDQSPLSWLDTAIENHRLSDWIQPPWTVRKRVRAFKELLKHWRKGIAILEKAEKCISPTNLHNYQRDLAVARAFGNMVSADINVTLFADLRDKYYDRQSERDTIINRMLRICRSHLELNDEMRELIRIDPRIGYHGEGHFMIISQQRLENTRGIIESLSKRLSRGLAGL